MFICSVKNVQAQIETDVKPLSEKIDDTANQLEIKLLLTKEQTLQVKNILRENISDSTLKVDREKILKPINDKVETVLTKKQKPKFDILKPKWLDEIIGTSD
jgi:predicted transcriptional regulator